MVMGGPPKIFKALFIFYYLLTFIFLQRYPHGHILSSPRIFFFETPFIFHYLLYILHMHLCSWYLPSRTNLLGIMHNSHSGLSKFKKKNKI